MKKLSILLLVVALAGGMAFGADLVIEGSAEFEAVVDIDAASFDNTYTPTSATDFELTISSGTGGATGEGDVYAVVEASASFVLDDAVLPAGTVSIDDFYIVAGDWNINLTGSPAAFDYAVRPWDDDDDGDLDAGDIASAFGDGEGVTVTYGDYTVGIDYSTVDAWALSGATSMEVADGVSLALGAAYGSGNAIGVSATIDTESVVASVDFDGAAVDASVTADFAPLSLAAFYGTDLEIRTTIDLDPVTVDVTGVTLLTTQDLSASATAVVDAATITVGGGYVVGTGAWDVNGEVEYVMDVATITVGAGYDGTDLTYNAGVVAPIDEFTLTAEFAQTTTTNLTVGVESSTVVDGATVSLEYASGDLASAVYGTVTAKVLVEF